MNYSVSVPHNTWTDIYTTIGVAIGTQLVIENTGAGDVLLSASASQPTDNSNRADNSDNSNRSDNRVDNSYEITHGTIDSEL